jgi:hypothetical protein
VSQRGIAEARPLVAYDQRDRRCRGLARLHEDGAVAWREFDAVVQKRDQNALHDICIAENEDGRRDVDLEFDGTRLCERPQALRSARRDIRQIDRRCVDGSFVGASGGEECVDEPVEFDHLVTDRAK